MKKNLLFLLALSFVFVSCNEKKAPGGSLFTVHKSADKPKIKVGDYVQVDIIQKNDKDSIIQSTYDMGISQAFPVGEKVYAGDMNDILSFFGEGDSVTFRLNLDTIAKYTNEPRLEQYKNDKYLNYTVKFHKVISKKQNEADSTFQKRATSFFQDKLKNKLEKKKANEENVINKYIAEQKLNVKTTPSGLRYVIIEPGVNEKPVLGDVALVNYVGKFTYKKTDGNDFVFDTNNEEIYKKTMKPNPMAIFAPREIPLSDVTAKGFVEGLQLIGIGGKIKLVIPSKLGYGDQYLGAITPYSTLVFDVELIDIKKGAAPVNPSAQ